MKYPFTLLLLCAVALIPAQAQGQAGSTGSEAAAANVGTDADALKKKAKSDEQTTDDKIKALEKTVAKESSKANRSALADFLESLASDSEKKNDWSGAWRYYQRAAAVLRDPAEQDWARRADEDTEKADVYRVKQTDRRLQEEEAKSIARRAKEMPAIVVPDLDWKVKEADRFAENRYREEVWKRIRAAWTSSEARRSIVDKADFKQPAVISFDVHTDGDVSDITITGTSGDRRIDLAALKTVEDLGKMEPLLPGMGTLVRFQTEFGK